MLVLHFIVVKVSALLALSVVFIYCLVWLAVYGYYRHQQYKQRRRKTQMWHHYRYQQDVLLQELTSQPMQPIALATIQQFAYGEQPYLMVHNIMWQLYKPAVQVSRASGYSMPRETLFHLHYHAEVEGQTSEQSLYVNDYLFITNHRILINGNKREGAVGQLSFDYAAIVNVHFYVDSMEIELQDGQMLLLHGYYQPQVMVRCYQLIKSFKQQKNS